jgi:hypothetical protein
MLNSPTCQTNWGCTVISAGDTGIMKSVDTAVVEISVMTALYQLMLRSCAAHVAQKNVLMSSTKKGSCIDLGNSSKSKHTACHKCIWEIPIFVADGVPFVVVVDLYGSLVY